MLSEFVNVVTILISVIVCMAVGTWIGFKISTGILNIMYRRKYRK